MRLRRRPVPCGESLLHVAKDLENHDSSKMNKSVLGKSSRYEHSWNMYVHILLSYHGYFSSRAIAISRDLPRERKHFVLLLVPQR